MIADTDFESKREKLSKQSFFGEAAYISCSGQHESDKFASRDLKSLVLDPGLVDRLSCRYWNAGEHLSRMTANRRGFIAQGANVNGLVASKHFIECLTSHWLRLSNRRRRFDF